MRTEALTAAETGVVDGHGFYEESYKLLHVVAQCDGHVEACDCGECVSAAAAAAAEECPWSIAGQIYLEGCYVGYKYYPHEHPGDSYHGTYACAFTNANTSRHIITYLNINIYQKRLFIYKLISKFIIKQIKNILNFSIAKPSQQRLCAIHYIFVIAVFKSNRT